MQQAPQRETDSQPTVQPLVSIVIPIYNVERFLVKCLQSVVQQTYRHLEIICVVDGSVDGSEGIARELSQTDERIKIICQANQGLSVARNVGVASSIGEFIFFLDADDWLECDAITHLVNAALVSGCNVVSGSVIEHWQSTGEQKPYWRAKKRKLGRLTLQRQDFFLLEVMVWNKLYRRDVVLASPFTPNLVHEDFDFYWRVFSDNPVVYAIKEPVVYYRRREGSLSADQCYGSEYQQHFITFFDHAWGVANRHPSLRVVAQKKALKYLKGLQKKRAPCDRFRCHIGRYGIRDSASFYLLLRVRALWDGMLTRFARASG
ncbi:MAG TPA: glycosyltransferase family 2 protein [Marinagarivorans sp.]